MFATGVLEWVCWETIRLTFFIATIVQRAQLLYGSPARCCRQVLIRTIEATYRSENV